MMEEPNGAPEYSRVIMSYQEAEKYSGAFWRRPTAEELGELTHFFAVDQLDSEIRLLGREAEDVRYIIELDKEKDRIFIELEPLTMVLDLDKLETQIFYTFNFMVSATEITHKFSFEEGMCKVLKRNGELKSIDPDDEILFEV